MVGKNKLVICQKEMVRAMQNYMQSLCLTTLGKTKVLSVKQIGAQLQRDFVVDLSAEIESPIDNAQQPK